MKSYDASRDLNAFSTAFLFVSFFALSHYALRLYVIPIKQIKLYAKHKSKIGVYLLGT